MTDNRNMIDVLIAIMRDRRASSRSVEIGAEVIASYARLDQRVSEGKRQHRVGEHVLEILDLVDRILEDCKLIAREFDRGMTEHDLRDQLAQIKERLDKIVL